MERNSVDVKGAKRYRTALIIFVVVYVIYAAGNIFNWWPPPPIIIRRYEEIEIWSACITKSTHAYTVTINFLNTGARTSIDSVLLNDVPYNDAGWTGTSIPAASGDITPETVINTGIWYCGTITFSDDCKDPSGNKLMAGFTIKITIHTPRNPRINTYYNTSVTLP